MYTVRKDGPDVHTTKKFDPDVYTTKKFGDTSISSCFSVLTCVPFWTEGVLMEGNGAAKIPLYP